MQTTAILMRAPGEIRPETVDLRQPGPGDGVVQIDHSGISTGTERLLYTGRMPNFPGMGYPLVPGYESIGTVMEAPKGSGLTVGDAVFVPGADCYSEVRGLFGGAAQTVICPTERLLRVDAGIGETGVLIALAATARHALAGLRTALPDLIVGHGVMGRLLARLTVAAGGPPPTVWEVDPARREGALGYTVRAPEGDTCTYSAIYDASGDLSQLDRLIGRLDKGGEIVLAGFYAEPVSFAFPPAFIKEARLRVSAEWTRADLEAVRRLIEDGHLDLSDLLTHSRPADEASAAYTQAFSDPACLKMCLNWKGCQ